MGRKTVVLGQDLAVLEDPPRAPKIDFIVTGFGEVFLESCIKAIETGQERGLVNFLAMHGGYIEDGKGQDEYGGRRHCKEHG